MHRYLALSFGSMLLAAAASGCVMDDAAALTDEDFGSDQQELSTSDSSASASCWSPPGPIDPSWCAGQEEVSRPPDPSGFCEIEIRLKKSSFVTGQGASEGRGEISFVATATSASSVVSASSPETKYSVGETKAHDLSLGSYQIQVGAPQNVWVCVDFTEHDNGGINGQDDVGSACRTVTLRCDPTVGQPTFSAQIGPAALCGPNQCNGSAGAEIEVMRADADGDCVPNEADVTPEICDELDKGTKGVALLLYYHYDDQPLTSLAQSIGTNLSKHFDKYDYVALVADNETSNILGTSGDAFRKADLVYPPTRDGVMQAMRDLTADGWRFDWMGHAHGYQNGASDAKFEVLSGSRISGNWLVSATAPTLIGTPRGTLPIIAYWSTTCYAKRLIDAFDTLGAITASGAFDINLKPTAWIPFWDSWVAGQSYRKAVDGSITAGVNTETDAYLVAQGELDPYWCITNTVLGNNACAEDFFNDDSGANPAMYNLQSFYDHSLTGAENVDISSERTFIGDDSVTFGGGGFSWP